jgi:hypothetical protein
MRAGMSNSKKSQLGVDKNNELYYFRTSFSTILLIPFVYGKTGYFSQSI